MSEQSPNQRPPVRTIPESEKRLAAYFAAQDREAQRYKTKIGSRQEVPAVVAVRLETKRDSGSAKIMTLSLAGRRVKFLAVAADVPIVEAARALLRPVLGHADVRGQVLIDLLGGLVGELPMASVQVPTKILIEVLDGRAYPLSSLPDRPTVRVSVFGEELTVAGELRREGVDSLWQRLQGPLGEPLRLSPEDAAKLREALFAL